MYLESLNRSIAGPPPIELAEPEARDLEMTPQPDLKQQLSERISQLTAELTGPKKRVQVTKSVEYPADFNPKLQIISQRRLGVWNYPDTADTCAICRSHLAGLCVTCQGHVQEAPKCTVHWGMCKHAYHGHCINLWIDQRSACPICQQPWELAEEEAPLE